MSPREAAALAACLAPCIAQAFPWEVRIEGQGDNLDKGYADWREAMAQIAWKPQRNLALLGGYRETERYDQRDREAFSGAYLPLGSDKTTLHFEGSASSTHLVLPRSMWLAEFTQAFGNGWVVGAGYKATRYSTGHTETVLGSLEWYLGDYRLGYNLYLARVEGSAWAPAHRFSASWYRSTLTHVTLSASHGREVENVFPTGLVSTDVSSVYLSGGIEIGPQWGLTGAIGQDKQGDLYTRRGVRIGTRILF